MRDLSSDDVTQANVTYHNELAETYDERIELFEPRVIAEMHRLLDDKIFRHLPNVADARMLDLGCGTGYLEQFLAPRCRNVTAVDVTPGMLAVARRKFPNVNFIEHDLNTFEIGTEQWDLVCENAVLHHILHWEPVFDRMMAGVKPGGFLLLGYEPNATAFRLLAPIRTWYRKLFAEHRVQEVNGTLGSEDLEAIAEYHQFFGYGMDYKVLAPKLRAAGFDDISITYATRSILAQIQDRVGLPLTALGGVLRFGPLTPNFHLIARKRARP